MEMFVARLTPVTGLRRATNVRATDVEACATDVRAANVRVCATGVWGCAPLATSMSSPGTSLS